MAQGANDRYTYGQERVLTIAVPGSYLGDLSVFGGALSATIGGSTLPKNTHIVVDLVKSPDLPPENDVEVAIDDRAGELTAHLTCHTPQAARKYFGLLLQALYFAG